MVTKLENLNWDKTQKLKKGEQTQLMTKVKNSICDKAQSIAKLKLGKNSNCDKTQIGAKLKKSN